MLIFDYEGETLLLLCLVISVVITVTVKGTYSLIIVRYCQLNFTCVSIVC